MIPNWINLSQTAGTGTTTVSVTASSYSELVERTGSLTVRSGDRSAVVTLAQRPNYTLELDPTYYTFDGRGGYFVLNITTEDSWYLTGPSWVEFSTTAGTGNAQVGVGTGFNTTYNNREGYIIVFNSSTQARTHVFQYPATNINGYFITSPISVDREQTTREVKFFCNGEWDIECDNFMMVSPSSGHSGSEITVTVTISENNSSSSRTGSIRLLSAELNSWHTVLDTLSVTQGAYVESISISPSAVTMNADGEAMYYTITTDYAWTLSLPDWMSSNVTSGVGNASVWIWPSYNNKTLRIGAIVASTSTSSASAIIRQYGPYPNYNYGKPLSFSALTSGSIEYWCWTDSVTGHQIEYSKDNGATWTPLNYTFRDYDPPRPGRVNLSAGDVIMFRGNNNNYWGLSFIIKSRCNVFGNIMSLVDPVNYPSMTWIPTEECFSHLFDGSSGIEDASGLVLPATTLTNGCYNLMFYACHNLVEAPELPATTLAEGCYAGMFANCNKLRNAPVLLADNLVGGCYINMFANTSVYAGHITTLCCLATSHDDSIRPTSGVSGWVEYWGGRTSNGVFIGDGTYPWERNSSSGIPNGWIFADISKGGHS